MDRRVLLAGFAATLMAVVARAAAEPRRIPVVARKFVFIPNEIAVRQGESVVLATAVAPAASLVPVVKSALSPVYSLRFLQIAAALHLLALPA